MKMDMSGKSIPTCNKSNFCNCGSCGPFHCANYFSDGCLNRVNEAPGWCAKCCEMAKDEYRNRLNR